MADDLATLIRLHKLELDEKRRVLAAIEARVSEAQAVRRALDAEMAAEKERAQATFEGGLTLGAYTKAALKRREQLDARIAQLLREAEAAREVVREAFAEVKRFELAKEARDAAEAAEAARRETLAFDETAAGQHQRQRAGGEHDTEQG